MHTRTDISVEHKGRLEHLVEVHLGVVFVRHEEYALAAQLGLLLPHLFWYLENIWYKKASSKEMMRCQGM